MKKRMLVTTIALVLVIAVALTTSSLAWFSSSSTVSTKELSFTADAASGTNLVLGDYGETDLATYGNSVNLPSDIDFNPVQGKVTFVGITESADNKLALATNPFYGSAAVVQDSGYGVEGQKVTFAGNGKYLAGGFNFANATGDAIEGGVTVKATITLTPVTSTPGTTHDVEDTTGTVKKNYVVYQGGWKGPGDTFDVGEGAAPFVVYDSEDVALLASIRIAVCGADNVRAAGATYDDAQAKVYAWGDKGFTLDNTGYKLVEGASQNKYVPGDDDDLLSAPEEDEKTFVYTNATDTYATSFETISYADGVFTFTYPFADTISPGEAGSIAFVIWMDGWDESALPGVSEGTFKMAFTLSK